MLRIIAPLSGLLWWSSAEDSVLPTAGGLGSIPDQRTRSCMPNQEPSSESECVSHSCPTLCDPMDYNLPGSSVYGILQARILEWTANSFSKGSSWLNLGLLHGRQIVYLMSYRRTHHDFGAAFKKSLLSQRSQWDSPVCLLYLYGLGFII